MKFDNARIWFFVIAIAILIALIVCSIVVWGKKKYIPETFTFTVKNKFLTNPFSYMFDSDSMVTRWIENFTEVEEKQVKDKNFYFNFQELKNYPVISTGKNVTSLSFIGDIQFNNENNITNLDIRRLPYLEKLILSAQDIKNLDILNNIFLKTITGILLPQLQTITLKNLPSLETLSLSPVYLLRSIQFSGVENLKEINLRNGKLQQFKVPGKKVIKLDLFDNNLTQDTVNTIMIDIKNNNIVEPTPPDNYFIDIKGGTNARPNGEGLTAMLYIINVLNWTVLTN